MCYATRSRPPHWLYLRMPPCIWISIGVRAQVSEYAWRQFNWLCLWTVFGSASVPINVRYLGLKQLCAKTLDTRWRLSLVKQRPFVVIVNEQNSFISVGNRQNITGSPTSFSGLRPNPAKFKTKQPWRGQIFLQWLSTSSLQAVLYLQINFMYQCHFTLATTTN